DKEYYDEQGHRRNTLDSRWAYVGIGHVVCNECHYWAIEYSSTATGVGETAANDSAATVSVKVSSDYYTASGITLTASAVEVTPSSTATVPSLSGQLSSSVIWPNNSINITSTPTWTVSDGSIASISGNTVTGLKNGSTTATANFLGTSLSFTITASGFPEETTTEEPTTEEPTTEEPTTEAPTTEAPTTQAPTTEAPTTEAPTTQAPTTEAPTTQAPTTEAPTTEAPTTQAPTTEAPEETTEEPEAEETTAESTEEETTEEETTKETTQDITEDDIATGRDGGGSLEGDFWERFLGLSGDEPTLIGIINDNAIGYETDYCVGRFYEIIGMGLEGICELGQ
ncbi:MAG: Ig-like domain-containing protein, partial [Lachnospiraceae bacterium]|nr:Ig-like domain-containing protein [Lachnospiraceae bacterium]